MRTKELSKKFKIPEVDVRVIDDIVNIHSGTRERVASSMMARVLGSDITYSHYLYLGYIIGERQAAEYQRAQFKTMLFHGKN